MKQPIIRLKFAEEEAPIDLWGIKGSEMAKVQSWTGFRSGSELREAITHHEDALAFQAVLCLWRQRRGEDVSFSDVDYDYDALVVSMVDDKGEAIEPVLTKTVPPRHRTDSKGRGMWTYVESGEPVPIEAA